MSYKGISKLEAYGLMNMSHHEQYEARRKEFESLGIDLTDWRTQFLYSDGQKEIICEFVDGEDQVRYRLMFQLNSVGRPSLGTTKKVSITLPDEVWEKIDEEKENMSMSAYLRFMIMQKFKDITRS